jgi:glycosyltransferase involved in cell wall biosynthesis
VDGGEVRIAVYDRYWSTLGGGEQFAGGIAAALRTRNDVDLIGPAPIDVGRFQERLGIDLAGLPLRRIDQESDVSVLSAGYDLLINCTYQSTAVNRARAGLYVVHFPGEVASARRRRLDHWRAAVGARLPASVVLRSGFYQPDRRNGPRRTDGAGLVDVYAPAGTAVTFTVEAALATAVELWDGRRLLVAADLASGQRAALAFEASGAWPQQVTIVSDTYRQEARPGVVWRYGVALAAVALDGTTQPAPGDRLRTKLLPPSRLGHLDSYDVIASNSRFTAAWVTRLWNRPSDVLYPPVRPLSMSTTAKEPIILNIGRFFDPRRGHSKKQLEMVQAFRRLHVSGRVPGWSLHLVGGCSPEDRDYAMAVKREALDLPVHVHLSAPGAVLTDLLARASLYWHAGGLGEDPATHPDRFEHFGISVVEAMGAGLVPVVFGAAGPAEVVRDGVDGHQFHDVDELEELTARLVAQPDERTRLAAAAVERAAAFGPGPFAERLERLVAGMETGDREAIRPSSA